MTTYSYISSGQWGSTKTINGIDFKFGVPVTFSKDQPILNEQVPEFLNRYVDNVLSNTDLIVPFTPLSNVDKLKYGSGTMITDYTAAELSAMALAGTLTPGATYVTSDTGVWYRAKTSYELVDDNVSVGHPAPAPSFLNLRRESEMRSVTLPNPYDYATFNEMTAKNQAETSAAWGGIGQSRWSALTLKNLNLHSSLVYVPGGFAGYTYWVAYTPMPFISSSFDSLFENPCVACSNDLQTWITPPGGVNPVVPPSTVVNTYNSDSHLYYDKINSRMVMIYRVAATLSYLKGMVSYDGINWTEPVTMWTSPAGNNQAVSPSIWWDGTQWVIYMGRVVEVNPAQILRMVSPDLFTGWPATPTAITLPVFPISYDGVNAYKVWHSFFNMLPDGRVAGILQMSLGSGSGSELWLAEAEKGSTTFYARKLESGFDSFYRSSFALIGGGKVIALYSYINSSPVFRGQIMSLVSLGEQPASFPLDEIARTNAVITLAKAANGASMPSGVAWVDSFTRADNPTDLGTSDSGGGYTYSGTQFVLTGNRAMLNATSGTGFARTADLPSTNYSVSVVIDQHAKSSATAWVESGIVFRSKDNANYYKLAISGGTGRIYRLFRLGGTGGNATLVLSSLDTARDGDILRVDCRGPRIELYLNGSRLGEVYDPDVSLMATGTKAGLIATGSAFQQAKLSNFTITTLS